MVRTLLIIPKKWAKEATELEKSGCKGDSLSAVLFAHRAEWERGGLSHAEAAAKLTDFCEKLSK